MNNIRAKLIYPEESCLSSFLEACIEEKEHGRKTSFFPEPDEFELWRHTIIQDSIDRRNGKNLKPGYVPDTTLWLVEENEFIGVINIRHYLAPSLERYGGHIGYTLRYSRRGMGYGTLMLKLALPSMQRLSV